MYNLTPTQKDILVWLVQTVRKGELEESFYVRYREQGGARLINHSLHGCSRKDLTRVQMFALASSGFLVIDTRHTDTLLTQADEYCTLTGRAYEAVDSNFAEIDISTSIVSRQSIKYIDLSRIKELQGIKSELHDLTKLVALCKELNICYENNCFLSTAMLVRSIMDHIPPIFNFNTFTQFANNYSGGKSFKESMLNLENSLRTKADAFLHVKIRNRESLPTRTQVYFASDLDALLAEIVRVLK